MKKVARIVLVVGLLLTIVAAVTVVLVPRWVKGRIIATAAAHGVALTIDDFTFGFSRARLKGVKASPLIRNDAKGAPKVTAAAASVDVDLEWFTPTAITVTGMTLDVDGDASDVAAALASRNKGTAAPASITHVTLVDSSLQWKHPVAAPFVAIAAVHVAADVTRKPNRALGEDWHVTVGDLRMFDTSKLNNALAPWSLTADADEIGTRATVTLPAKATVKIDVTEAGARSLDIDTPPFVVKDLGMPPEVLALYGDDTSHLEVHVHHQEKDPDHAQGTVVLTGSDVFVGPSTMRTSFALDAHYSGDPKTSLKLSGATLRAGPFTGALDGTFALDPATGVRASLRYSSGVMACIDAVKAQAANYGDLGKGVATLAGLLGLDRAVQGRVWLKGEIEIDARTSTNRVSFRTDGDCKLSYLPAGL